MLDQEFKYPSNTSDKEALFVPSGFDSLELVDSTSDFRLFLANIMKQMKDAGEMVGDEPSYEDVIKKPIKGGIMQQEEKK